ncbi:MAG: PQQ-binding-like beta-propeller repeat protein [Christensenellales bacterium]|jgi:outer membrane protein assembly factor BamB
MSSYHQPQQPRRRRADRHRQPESTPAQQPQRAGFPQDEQAPMPLGGYDASQPRARQAPPQVYEESNYNLSVRDPQAADRPAYDDYYHDDDELHPRRWPLVLLSLLLLCGLLLAGSYFLIPKDATGILGSARSISTNVVDSGLKLLGLKKTDPPRLIKFDTPEYTVQTGVKTVFTFTADKAIDGVRIIDEVGNEINGVTEAVDAPNNTIWTLSAILTKPMSTTLTAGIVVGKVLYTTDKTIHLTVAAPTATPEPPTPTPEPPTPTPDPPPSQPPAADPTGFIPPTEQIGQDAASAQSVTATPVSLLSLLPVFTQAPPTSEFPEEEIPEDMMAELPEDEIPEDIMAELPENEIPEDMMAETPEDEIPEDMMAEFPEDGLPEDMMAQEPTETPPPKATPAPTATPMPALVISAHEDYGPQKTRISEAAYIGSKKQSDYQRAEPLNAQGGDLYTYYPGGVFTFRGDNMRQNAAFGVAPMPLEQMSIRWQAELGGLHTKNDGTLYGMGWTGQPAIVKWTLETRSGMNIVEDKINTSALKEVIAAAQDGKVYFLDLADGQPTRDPIDIGYPLKGSVAVDAFGRPLIAFGQGVSIMPGKTGQIGMYLYNLIDQSQAMFINGRQTKSQKQHSTNGAFDGTGLFLRDADTFVVAGENGLLYTVKLNTVYDFKNPTSLTIDPQTVYLLSKTAQQKNTSVSVEGSTAMYGPYAFIADKQGILRAVDTTTMQTVWAFDTGDNTDATPALDLENNDTLALYTGTTVFARTRRDGNAVLRRINALTGEEVWAVSVKAKYDKDERGGLKASPVVGQGQIADLVIFTVNLTEDGATVLALNKQTGQEFWRLPVPGGAISSPVAVYDADGRARVVQAGLDGTLYLIEARSGRVLHTLNLEGAIEGSPAVYNEILVIGTASRDNHRLYGIRLE